MGGVCGACGVGSRACLPSVWTTAGAARAPHSRLRATSKLARCCAGPRARQSALHAQRQRARGLEHGHSRVAARRGGIERAAGAVQCHHIAARSTSHTHTHTHTHTHSLTHSLTDISELHTRRRRVKIEEYEEWFVEVVRLLLEKLQPDQVRACCGRFLEFQQIQIYILNII